MALEAGRVGVRKDQVDSHGRIKSSGGETDPAVTQLQEQVGTYSFRTNPEDGSAQYKQSDTSDWVNFSSGGGASPVLLWENENVSSGLAAGTTIPLDMGQYTHFIVEAQPQQYFHEHNMSMGFTLIPNIVGTDHLGRFSISGGRAGDISYSRQGYCAENGLCFEYTGVYVSVGFTGTNGKADTFAIPTKIYGINLDL